MSVPRVDQFTAQDSETVVPSDTVNITKGVAKSLYVGVSGDVTLVTPLGTVQLYSNVPVGFMPVQFVRVDDTGTTATDMVALV